MKVSNSQTLYNTKNLTPKTNIRFGAGITNFLTDFDGTYMPLEYSQDSVCRDKPPVDRGKFEKYFSGFRRFKEAIKGNSSDSKFNFTITTGRNLPEFNYFVNNLRQKGLNIPLPETLVTCNGGAEYKKTINDQDFYSGKVHSAISPEDVSKEKKEWLKKSSGGYDGDKIKADLKNMLSDAVVDENYIVNASIIKKYMNVRRKEVKNIYLNLISDKYKSEELGSVMSDMFKDGIAKSQEDPEIIQRDISKLASNLSEVRSGKNKLKFIEAPTNNCALFYGDGMSLQEKLEKMGSPKHYISVRDDGNMNFHIALDKDCEDARVIVKNGENKEVRDIYHHIHEYFTKQPELLNKFLLI